ncbi:MAG: neutral/alkaline non-lysosomal ceramidase N-terminal domain-containing protein, partial [Armatimonadota bacterium]
MPTCYAQLEAIEAGPLKVGIATADITPEGSVWMAGFSARKKPSEGVWKELGAQCVVFDNGVTRVAFVALDLCKILEPQLADLRAAARKAGIPPQHVMINASHTHSGPTLSQTRNADYVALFKARTDPLFAAARADLQPAVLDYTVGSCTMAINRRQFDAEGKVTSMRPEPRKQIDPDVPILRVLSPEGDVRAVLFGYACHPSTMNTYELGPDYVGYARDWIAAAYPDSVPVFLQGCGGDIKPRYTRPDGRFGFVLLDPVATTAELGHELGRAVVSALVVPPEPVPAGRSGEPEAATAAPVRLGGIVEKVNVPDKTDPEHKSHQIYMGAWRVGDVYVFGSQCE